MGGVTISVPPVTPYRPEPFDPLQQYAKLVQLRNLQQAQQLQGGQLQLQQQIQQGQLQMQAAQRKQQEGEAFRQAYSSAAQKMPNATQADLIDATTKQLSGNPNRIARDHSSGTGSRP
jgi:hypothetical protein